MKMSKHKLKIGIIGAGIRGTFCFGKNIVAHNDAEIVALCDPNQTRMKCAAKELGGKYNFYASVEEMAVAETLDAAVIASPDCCHESNAVAALNCGINVLVDKPLSTTVKGCQNIIRAAEKTGMVIMMGFNLRHHAVLKRLKQLVSDGVLGKIFLIENREFYSGGRTYMSRWNRLYAKSGGLWVHKGSHDFDVFNWLLGFPKPVKVSSFAGVSILNPGNIPFEVKPGIPVGPDCKKCVYRALCPDNLILNSSPNILFEQHAVEEDGYSPDLCMYTSDKDTHDNGIAIVEYENGVRTSHLECFITPVTDRLYTVVGDLGQADVSLEQRTIIVRPRWNKEVITYNIPEIEGGHGGADPFLLDAFIKVIKGETTNSSTVEQGMWSTAIGQAAEISRREGRTIQVEELFK
jgi:predicted dehydrogenase